MPRSSNMSPVTILKSIFIGLYVCGVLFTATEACDGYKIKINKLESCDDASIFKLEDFNLELSKDCKAIPTGCLHVTKGFSDCKVVYDVKKRGMMVPFKGEKDVCEEVEKACKDPDTAAKVKSYGVEPKCPIKDNKYCSPGDASIDLSSYKDKFRLAAGQYTGTINFQCNSGTSCFKFDVEFKRGK